MVEKERKRSAGKSGTGLVVVTGSGDSNECSASHPCRSLTSAVSRAKTIGVDTIHVGEGDVGTVKLPNDFGILTIRPHIDFEKARTNNPSSSFSLTCGEESGAVLDILTLSPLQGLPLLSCELDSQPSLIQNCHIISVNGISAPLFSVSDGAQLDFNYDIFENISQVSSALISAKNSARVSVVRSVFRQTETTHSLIVITAGGSCSAEVSVFHTITRSEGEGAAAIDIAGCQAFSLIIITLFRCVSKEGKAGAITIAVSDPSTLSFAASFLNNRGRDENCAHDMFLSGFDTTLVVTIVLLALYFNQ